MRFLTIYKCAYKTLLVNQVTIVLAIFPGNNSVTIYMNSKRHIINSILQTKCDKQAYKMLTAEVIDVISKLGRDESSLGIPLVCPLGNKSPLGNKFLNDWLFFNFN